MTVSDLDWIGYIYIYQGAPGSVRVGSVPTSSGSYWFRFMPVPVPTSSRLTEPGSRFPVPFRGFPDALPSSSLHWCQIITSDLDAGQHGLEHQGRTVAVNFPLSCMPYCRGRLMQSKTCQSGKLGTGGRLASAMRSQARRADVPILKTRITAVSLVLRPSVRCDMGAVVA